MQSYARGLGRGVRNFATVASFGTVVSKRMPVTPIEGMCIRHPRLLSRLVKRVHHNGHKVTKTQGAALRSSCPCVFVVSSC